jgi:hypothetical protein
MPLAIRRAGASLATCDDVRAGCATLVPRAQDGVPGERWHLEERKGER